MIQRIFATLIIAALYFLFAVQSTPQAGSAGMVLLDQGEQVVGSEIPSADPGPAGKRMDLTSTDQDIAVPVSSPVAQFNENDRSWTFSATVNQIKDVSIYGRPGTIAQIKFIREGEVRYAWTVIQIDDYYFANDALTVGRQIVLETAGPHVSSQGVNWDACPPHDLYCRYAEFIEGGFLTSEDYNGLTICPSNRLIYSGDASSDWINGMLAWKIKIVD